MHLYILKDAGGTILAAHTDRHMIRDLFFSSLEEREIWIMHTSDATGVVEAYSLFLTKPKGVSGK